MTTDDLPVLELTDVQKTFRPDAFKKPIRVINGLSLKFRKGICTGLLGHNGAGKTTTIRLILGLIRPDRGKILTFGHPMSTEDRRHIGYMPEINKLPAALTPQEILTFQMKLFRKDELADRDVSSIVAQKLQEVGLWIHRGKRVSQLSKGLGRRLGWAQATIHDPSLVILDEPFSGLDPLGRESMHEWILALKKKGTSIVLCTHELMNTQTLCDDYFVLQRGNLVHSYAQPDPEEQRDGADSPFEITVSGLVETKVPEIIKRHGLATPLSLERRGFLLRLNIENQSTAQKWLQGLLADGYVVVGFGENTKSRIDHILTFFRGGDGQ